MRRQVWQFCMTGQWWSSLVLRNIGEWLTNGIFIVHRILRQIKKDSEMKFCLALKVNIRDGEVKGSSRIFLYIKDFQHLVGP